MSPSTASKDAPALNFKGIFISRSVINWDVSHNYSCWFVWIPSIWSRSLPVFPGSFNLSDVIWNTKCKTMMDVSGNCDKVGTISTHGAGYTDNCKQQRL